MTVSVAAPPQQNWLLLVLRLRTFVALILVLAANTACNGFPVLGSILAQDSYLPRQLHTRGDRLAFSNGILFLAFAAIAFVVAFKAEVTALIWVSTSMQYLSSSIILAMPRTWPSMRRSRLA